MPLVSLLTLSALAGDWMITRDPLRVIVALDDDPALDWIAYEGGGNSSGTWAIGSGATGRAVGSIAGSLLIVRTKRVGGWPVIQTWHHMGAADGGLTTWEVRDGTYTETSVVRLGIDDSPEQFEALLHELEALAGSPRAQFPTLCDPGTTAFACETANRKIVSVCTSSAGLQYRFGKPGAPELVFPAVVTGPTPFRDATTAEAFAVSFTNGDVGYRVYEGRTATGRGPSGVEVTSAGKTLADVRCGPTVIGTLRELPAD